MAPAQPCVEAIQVVDLQQSGRDRRTSLWRQGHAAEYKTGLDLAISLGWLKLHKSGTFVKLTQSGADLFA
jgi:hypothetical protein